MNNNNEISAQSNMPEPTLSDIFNLLQKCASKDDLNNIEAKIVANNANTIERIEDVDRRVFSIENQQQKNTDNIQMLITGLEQMKQEQLKNNVCISGVPVSVVNKDKNTSQVIIAIAKSLGIDLNASQFSSYPVADNKFIIVRFYNLKHKQTLLNKIRIKKSLMVEEVFRRIKSNSQIYLNDHLTPYFNNLYLIARKAKKEGKLASASSYGGKIRARKLANDMPIVITCEQQLQLLIDYDNECDMSLNTSQQTKNNTSSNNSVSSVSPGPSHAVKETKKKSNHKKNSNGDVLNSDTNTRAHGNSAGKKNGNRNGNNNCSKTNSSHQNNDAHGNNNRSKNNSSHQNSDAHGNNSNIGNNRSTKSNRTASQSTPAAKRTLETSNSSDTFNKKLRPHTQTSLWFVYSKSNTICFS